MDASAIVATMGVPGVLVVLCLIAVREMWKRNRELENKLDELQSRVLPVLTTATAAMADFARTAAVLLDHNRRD